MTMTFPSKEPPTTEPEVYTELTDIALLGIKERLVSCPYCKVELMTSLPAPKHVKCGHSLITVIKTNVELANGNS